MLRIRFLKWLFVLYLASGLNSYAGWDDINWATCGPGSIARTISKFISSEKVFWAKHLTDIEAIAEINMIEYPGWKQDCLLNNSTDSKKAACVMDIDLKIKNIYRCQAHATQMCRLNGGFC